MSFATLLLGPLCVFNSHTPIYHCVMLKQPHIDINVNQCSVFDTILERTIFSSTLMFYFVMYTEHSDLFSNILRKHGAEGDQQLGQAQFAQLLQLILQDLADGLAEKPVVVIQNLKVVNGSKIKKV